MTCKHCGGLVRTCYDGQCTGWAKTAEGCRGYVHADLFHGCEDGERQAEISAALAAAVRSCRECANSPEAAADHHLHSQIGTPR